MMFRRLTRMLMTTMVSSATTNEIAKDRARLVSLTVKYRSN
jgi:hypothetical protein